MKKTAQITIKPILKQYIFELGANIKPPITAHYVMAAKPVEIAVCECNPNLRLFEIVENITSDIDNINTISYAIQLQNGDYYEVLNIMPNGIYGSPDNEDPPPKNSPSPNLWADFERDTYEWLKKEYFDATKNIHNEEAPVVAVLDTGIDLTYFKVVGTKEIEFPLHYYQNPCDIKSNLKCVVGLGINYNKVFGRSFIREGVFIDFPDNPFDDDARHKHGTRIAKIIANATDNNVRIMSLKTANAKGEHQFFDVFCAFEYIIKYNNFDGRKENDKVKFINASWGYYGPEYRMFTNYMEKLLLNGNSIKFVNAAGNNGDLLGLNRVEIGQNVNRYPTMYSENFPVYTATTVDKNGQAVENYSDRYVEVGVIGEINTIFVRGIAHTLYGIFPDPLPSIHKCIKGSSYATAYLTGFLIKNFNQSGNFEEDYNRNYNSGNAYINVGVIDPININPYLNPDGTVAFDQ